jgi:hypothetical protein
MKKWLLVSILAIGLGSVSIDAVPPAPSNLTAVVSGHAVFLSWSPPPGQITAYYVAMGLSPGTTIAASSLPPNQTSGIAQPIPPGTFYFRVHAVDATGLSAPSNEVVAVVSGGGCVGPPAAPVGLAANVAGTFVTVNFGPGGGCPATNYALHAGSGPGLSNIAIANLGTMTGLATLAPPGTYYVRVFAQNAAGTSPPSNEIIVDVGVQPAGNLTGTWNGTLSQPQGPYVPVFNYTMQLLQNGAQVTGTARISVPSQPQYFGDFVLSGTVDAGGNFNFQELRVTAQQVPSGTAGWCLKSGTLREAGGAPRRLVGNWTAPGCPPGSIDLTLQ